MGTTIIRHLKYVNIGTHKYLLFQNRRNLTIKSKIFQAENEDKEEERFELLEFAQNYFNEHEKSPNGTIVGTLKRSKTIEMLSKTDMISYYKGNSIPNSHIHMFDPENVNIACNIFKDLIKYAKGKCFSCDFDCEYALAVRGITD